MLGVLLGIAAAVCWGLGDFLITYLTRYVGTKRALLMIQALSLSSWIVLALIYRQSLDASPNLWGIIVLAGVFHVAGLAFTYKAFEIGTLSLVSPIASSYAIVYAVLFWTASGTFRTVAENPRMATIAPIVGVLLLVAGVVFVSRSPNDGQKVTLAGLPQAVLSALCFGLMFWLLFHFNVFGELGYFVPLIVLKLMATGYAVAGLAGKQTPGEMVMERPRVVWPIAVGAALFDTLAWLSWIAGMGEKDSAIVTALSSLFSAVTVLLAWAILKERLSRPQWAGVAVILAGVAVVSITW